MSKRFTDGSWRAAIDRDELPDGSDGGMRLDILKNDGDADDDGRMVDASYTILEGAYLVLEDDDENTANANLIAAAPDLYDVLSSTLPILRGIVNGLPVGPSSAILQSAEMVLAYARGENPHIIDGES